MSKAVFQSNQLVLMILVASLFIHSSSSAGLPAQTKNGGSVSSILYVNDKQVLLRDAVKLEDGAVLRRACEIQRVQSSPPVSCFAFAKSDSETNDLTKECERLAARALVLPALNAFVTDQCRRAIESRNLDLKYVSRQDSLVGSAQTPDASR